MGNQENLDYQKINDLPEVTDGNGFINILDQKGIRDINDPRMDIKIINNIYIFVIDGMDSFSVSGKNRFEELKTALKSQEIQETTTNTQLELTDIRLNVDVFKNRLNTYKEFYKKQKSESKSNSFWMGDDKSGKEKTAYRITAKEADTQLRKIEAIEKRFNQLINPKRYKNPELARIEREVSMEQLSAELDEVWAKLPEFVKYRNDIAAGNLDAINTPPFALTINSGYDARKIRDILKKFNKQELKLDQYAADAATQQMYASTLQSLENYFEEMVNNPNAFYPYNFDAKQIAAINYFPALKQAMTDLDPNKPETQTNTQEIQQKITNTQPQGTENLNTREQYTDWKDAFARGGIKGLTAYGLDQTKMSDQQKEAWSGVGNLALLGGGIFLGWKFLSTGFKALSKKGREELNKDGGRGWLWLPVAGTFASNAITGESPLALLSGGKATEYITNLFGGKRNETNNENNNTQNSTAETYGRGFVGATALFEGRSCGEVADAVEENNGRMRLKPSFYDNVISYAEGHPSDSKKVAAAQFLKYIGKDDPNNLMHTTLSSMGLDYTTLKNAENVNKPFNERAAGAITRLASITEYMDQNHYDRINQEQLPLIQDYIANKDGKMEDLDALQKRRGDIFEDSARAPDENIKTELKTKVNALTLSEEEKKTLYATMKNFWAERPLSKDLKTLDLKQKGSNVELTTYGKTTLIDLKNKTLVGLEDANKRPICFQSYFEVIKAANLTNRIFDLVKNNPNPAVKDPFNVSWIGQDIEYNNTKFWSNPVDRFNHMDITVASGGYKGALGTISNTLEDQKEGYVTYLNKQFNTINNLTQ